MTPTQPAGTFRRTIPRRTATALQDARGMACASSDEAHLDPQLHVTTQRPPEHRARVLARGLRRAPDGPAPVAPRADPGRSGECAGARRDAIRCRAVEGRRAPMLLERPVSVLLHFVHS